MNGGMIKSELVYATCQSELLVKERLGWWIERGGGVSAYAYFKRETEIWRLLWVDILHLAYYQMTTLKLEWKVYLSNANVHCFCKLQYCFAVYN